MRFSTETSVEDGVAVIRVESQHLANADVRPFLMHVARALREAPLAVIDLSDVIEMASEVAVGLAKLLASRAAEAGGYRYAMVAPPAAVKRLFTLLGVESAVALHDFTDSAIAALQAFSLTAAGVSAQSAFAQASYSTHRSTTSTMPGSSPIAIDLPDQRASSRY